MKIKTLPAVDQILLAARRLPEDGFTRSELVIACWEDYPERFAMRGYPHLPDNKRVEMELPKLMKGRGHIGRLDDGRLVLTIAGRKRAQEMLEGGAI